MTASAGPVLKKLYEEYVDRVAFVTLYVREAHPSERYPQPDDNEKKIEYARVYKGRDDIPWPVAVDDVSGDLHQKLAPKANAAYIMGTDGSVLYRSLWSNDESTLRTGLEAAVSQPTAPAGERQTRMVPMLRGTGMTYDILDFSGEQAKKDYYNETPALYAAARLASTFRPLPPLWRSVAAVTIGVVGITAAFLGMRELLRRSDEHTGRIW